MATHAPPEIPEVLIITARRWLLIAVSSLLLAGCLSLMLIIGRMPPFSTWMTDPEFFKRCLVVHVDLALIVWFYAFAAALFVLGPGKSACKLGSRSFYVAGAGVLAMVLAAGVPNSVPILANYVPVIDHPLFLTGLVLFAVGLVATLLTGLRGLRPSTGTSIPGLIIPRSAEYAFFAMALVVVIAALTFVISWFTTPLPSTGAISLEAYYELLFWGGGHVLQVASVLTMLGVWILLLRKVLGVAPVRTKTAAILFACLVIPQLAAPWLALYGTTTPLYHTGFTRLMQFGIFPFVTVFLGLSIRTIIAAHRDKRLTARSYLDPAMIGFVSSATLTVLGFTLGAMIRGSNTMIPAHYHASLGAVTVSLMTVTFLLLAPLGLSVRGRRLNALARIQPALFGVGQTIFAVGFAIGGLYGLGRKAYATEQYVRSTAEIVGLCVMGLGGILAIFAGLIYLAVIVTAYSSSITQRVRFQRRTSWNKKIPRSTPSRS